MDAWLTAHRSEWEPNRSAADFSPIAERLDELENRVVPIRVYLHDGKLYAEDADRKAFDAAILDSDYRADTKKRNQEIEPHNGAEVTALIQKVLATPKDIVERAIAAISR